MIGQFNFKTVIYATVSPKEECSWKAVKPTHTATHTRPEIAGLPDGHYFL